jgi:hypothetical protein
MARSRLLRLLAPLLLVAACGGGRSGTGISESVEELVTRQPAVSEPATAAADTAESVLSTIEGNVAQLSVAMHPSTRRPTWLASLLHLLGPLSAAHAGPALDGIRVSVEGFDPSTETDPDGSFLLSGEFSGPSIVHFERADDALEARMTVNVPKGGVLSLRDLTLDATRGVASPGTQDLSFDGIIADKDCLQRRLELTSRFAPQGERFLVELEGSTISDGSGERQYCLNLRRGDDAHVDGTVQPNGTISDANMIVDGERRLREAMTTSPWVARALP